MRSRLPAYGIVLLRINPADSALKLVRLRHLIQHHAQRLPGSFVVVSEKRAGFRSLERG